MEIEPEVAAALMRGMADADREAAIDVAGDKVIDLCRMTTENRSRLLRGRETWAQS